jgi:AraC-like DNA-binding protein
MKISALHLQSFLEFAQVRGLARADLLVEMQENPFDFSDPTATVKADDFYAVMARIYHQLKDDLLGLRMGAFLNLSALGLIYQISLQTTTVEEAIFYLKNFVNASFPIIHIEADLKESEGSLALQINNEKTALNRIILESVVTIIAREMTMMSTSEVVIQKISPFYTPDYPEDFRVGEKFGLEFSGLQLKAALRKFDHQHLDCLVPEYLKLINGFKNENNFQNKVRIATLNMARPELPGLAAVADNFHLTPRTFQRQLAKENITFREIVDDLKKQISGLLLRHNQFSIADVSHILGYSESAAFLHSYKKWHGNSPGMANYRNA